MTVVWYVLFKMFSTGQLLLSTLDEIKRDYEINVSSSFSILMPCHFPFIASYDIQTHAINRWEPCLYALGFTAKMALSTLNTYVSNL